MGEVGSVTKDITAGPPGSHAFPSVKGHVVDPAVQALWDAILDRAHLWSGQPNGVLMVVVAGLTPGQVLAGY